MCVNYCQLTLIPILWGFCPEGFCPVTEINRVDSKIFFEQSSGPSTQKLVKKHARLVMHQPVFSQRVVND